jgi:hypothetical protein
MNARSLWAPVLADKFGVRPWDMHRVTARELYDMQKYLLSEANGG